MTPTEGLKDDGLTSVGEKCQVLTYLAYIHKTLNNTSTGLQTIRSNRQSR